MFGLGFGSKPFAGGFRPILPPQPPATPSNFQATAGDAFVTLSWDSVPNATSYEVAIGTSANPTNWWDVGNVTSYEIGGLKNSTTYYVRVRAVNNAGASTPTSDLSRTPISDSGYSQIDADAGWRFPGNTLDQNSTVNNRSWLGNPEHYTRATRGIYKNTSNYNGAYLNLSSAGQVRRIRARLRDGSSVTDAFVLFFRSDGTSYNNLWTVEWYNDNYIALYSVTGGTATSQGSSSYTRSANGSYLLEVIDNGADIVIKINGNTLITFNSTLYATNKYVGISEWLGTNASIDWISYDQASTSQDGNASGSLPALDVSPPAASATGGATASGSLPALDITPPAASATGAATASGSLPALDASPLTASATGSATASGSLPALDVTPPAAEGSSVILAEGSLPPLDVSPPAASATGDATASGALPALDVTPPQATATGDATASGSFAPLWVVPPSAQAQFFPNAFATSSFPPLWVEAPQVTAKASATATASFPTINASPPQASGGLLVTASGSLPALSVSPPQAAASGSAVAEARPPLTVAKTMVRGIAQVEKIDKGYGTSRGQS